MKTCCYCKRSKPALGHLHCQFCMTHRAAQTRKRRAAHASAGLCVHCSQPVVPGCVECTFHQNYRRAMRKTLKSKLSRVLGRKA